MMTSSGARATGSPSTTTVAVPLAQGAATARRRRRAAIGLGDVLDALAEPLAQRAEVGLGGGVDQRAADLARAEASEATLSSSVICGEQVRGRASSKPDAATSARDSGWRVLTPDSARVARPSSTSRRTRAICVDSAGSIERPGRPRARWRGARTRARPGSTGTTRSCQTRSVMNGVSGAISRVTVSTTSCRVRSAAVSPCQKRRRRAAHVPVGQVVDERRRAACRRAGCRTPPAPASTWSTRRVQLATAASGPGPGGRPGPGRAATGAQPAVRAYRAWKATVFQ